MSPWTEPRNPRDMAFRRVFAQKRWCQPRCVPGVVNCTSVHRTTKSMCYGVSTRFRSETLVSGEPAPGSRKLYVRAPNHEIHVIWRFEAFFDLARWHSHTWPPRCVPIVVDGLVQGLLASKLGNERRLPKEQATVVLNRLVIHPSSSDAWCGGT